MTRLALAVVVIAGVVNSGCEVVFSFSPFAFLARDPATLPAATRVAYAQNALRMGDPATMSLAYNAMIELCTTSPENAAYALVAGELAAELSGVPLVVDALLRGEIRIFEEGALSQIEEQLQDVDTTLIISAAHYYEAARAAGGELRSSHYIVGAFGLLVEASLAAGGLEQLDEPESWNSEARAGATTAATFLSGARDLYEPGDPALVFVNGFVLFFEQFASLADPIPPHCAAIVS